MKKIILTLIVSALAMNAVAEPIIPTGTVGSFAVPVAATIVAVGAAVLLANSGGGGGGTGPSAAQGQGNTTGTQ